MSVAEQSMKEDFAALLNESFNAEEVMECGVMVAKFDNVLPCLRHNEQ